MNRTAEPLLRIGTIRAAEHTGWPAPDGAVAEQLGVTSRTIIRWRNKPETSVPAATADRCADQLGLHWAEIWPDVAQAQIDAEVSLMDNAKTVDADTKNIFIDDQQAQAAKRAKKAAEVQRWREKNRDHVRQYNRAYYQANLAYYQADARRRRTRIDPETGLTAGAAAMRQWRARRAGTLATPDGVIGACVNGDTAQQEVA